MPIQRLQGPSLGNVTANTLTTTASVNAATFYAGANVSLNTSAIFVGNSTVNTVITSTGFAGVLASPSGFSTTLVAGETLAALDAVYVEPALTGATAGRVYKMDADVLVKSTQAFFAGFALANASASANVVVQQSGIVGGFVGLTPGTLYYASATAGAVTATKPLHPIPVGIAISTTQLLVNAGQKRENEQRGAVYGYASGGTSGAYVATTDRTTFSTGVTAASTISNLSQARIDPASVSDSSVYGYVLGGYSASAEVATADQITFATSVTTASTVSNLSQVRRSPVGISDGTVYGYVLGGTSASGVYVKTGDRITFSTSSTAASTVSNVSAARGYMSGISDDITYGYATGGYAGVGDGVTTTDRITFSTSATAAATVSNLPQGLYYALGLSDNSVYGYVLGGTSASITSAGIRITFSTGVFAASTVSNLSVARYGAAACSDGSAYGYALGGRSSAVTTTADRLTFSTSVTAAFTAANLSQARNTLSGLSDGAV